MGGLPSGGMGGPSGGYGGPSGGMGGPSGGYGGPSVRGLWFLQLSWKWCGHARRPAPLLFVQQPFKIVQLSGLLPKRSSPAKFVQLPGLRPAPPPTPLAIDRLIGLDHATGPVHCGLAKLGF
ncbi:hypothetical protein PCASD_21394 [Puccinia coronata f. sp. avenae]|uniref:Uncharacterized protein n=1 Tax=Puccinia coronata f. sp. avenae TaxID=200324 RepID=A0A2N5TYM0_9BASI|nr:hypothetical protein PCASD_21394 [Puccinia coronata f. sp. avenae]